MTYGMDLLVNPDTGDLDITGNDFNFTENTSQSLRQRIELRLNTWQEEWSYNTVFGLPVRQKLLANAGGLNKAQINAEYISQINQEPDVTAIKDIKSSFDPSTRVYQIISVDVYNNDSLYSLSLVNSEASVYSYPEPINLDNINICGYSTDIVTDANRLYEFINYDLPITGDSTWWQLWNQPSPIAGTFANLGDIILTSENILYNYTSAPVFSLLTCNGSTFDQLLYPNLYALMGANTLENLTPPVGSPYQYKIVADY